MDHSKIGSNANIVWLTLYSAHDKVSLDDLQAKTSLSAPDILIAIGWLACEGQIVINQEEGRGMYFTIHHETFY